MAGSYRKKPKYGTAGLRGKLELNRTDFTGKLSN